MELHEGGDVKLRVIASGGVQRYWDRDMEISFKIMNCTTGLFTESWIMRSSTLIISKSVHVSFP